MTFDVITRARVLARRRFVTAASALLIAVIGCAIGRATAINEPTPPQPADPTGPTPMVSSVDTTTPVPGVGAVTLPADVTWIQVAGVALPVSSATGPTVLADGLTSGFAHTPDGAAVAALHLMVRVSPNVGPDVFDPTITTHVTGPDAAAFAAGVAGQYTATTAKLGVGYGQPLGDLPATLAGVRIDTSTDERVVVSVLAAMPDAAGVLRHAATALTVVWVEGDWRLLAPPQGRWDDLVTLVDPAQTGAYPPLAGR